MTLSPTSGLNRDPDTEYEDIVRWLGAYEFGWDIERALEFALFRTYAVPSISGLLERTGKFENEPLKRYDDTELLLSEPVEHGFNSERGQEAIERINAIHGRFRITNDDMLYVLTTFVCEPVRWCAAYAKRPFTAAEEQAWTNYYREMGKRMGIKEIPETYAGFDRLNREVEAERFVFAESNRTIGNASVDLFLGFYLPKPLWGLGRPVILSLMDPPLLDAMGFDHPLAFTRGLVAGAMALRKSVLKILPRRRKPYLIAARKRPAYPGGYVISELGNGPVAKAG